MKIIYLHQYFTTPSHAGGVRSYEFAKRLTEKGVAVDMITSSAFFPVKRGQGEFFVSRRKVDNIDVHIIHSAYNNSMNFPRRIFAFLAFMIISSIYVIKLKQRDLVFATSTPLTIAIPGLIAKTVHRIPMIFEVRDVWPDIPIAMGIIKNRYIKKILFGLEQFIYAKSDKIITLSTGMEEEIRCKNVPHEKIITIPNACDTDYFGELVRENSTDILTKYKETQSTKICLYAGTFGLVNNVDYMIDLCREIKKKDYDIKLIMVGSGALQQHISDRIESENLENQVILLPPVPKKVLIRYLDSADACISTVQETPALYNNSANKFFDALAAGRPIIINHGGWQADVIIKNQLGLILTYNFTESAERLNTYLLQIDKSEEEDRIKSFARTNYDRDLLFKKLYDEAFMPLL